MGIGAILIPHFTEQKLRLREVKSLVRSHIARTVWSWNRNWGLPDS